MIDYLLVNRTCTKCLSEKDISEFGVDKQKKDGVSSHCRECRKRSSNKHYAENTDYYKKRNRNFYANLSPEKKLQYRKTCNANPSNKAYRKEWQLANKEKVSAYSRKWAAKIPPEFLARKRKEYRASNPDIFAKHSVKRRSSEKAATPLWTTDDDTKKIKLIYLKRDFINEVTGIKHEVDHIYPIQGKYSCGLHVYWNLRIITATENRSKKNSMPYYA